MLDKAKIQLITIDQEAERVSYKYHKVPIAPLEWMIPRLLERASRGYKVVSVQIQADFNLLGQL